MHNPFTICCYDTVMKKIIQIAIIGIGLVVMSGCEANGRYKLSSKMTGTLGVASASTVEKNGRYSIDISVTTQGLYNLIKGKRTEKYSSKGHIKKGIYYSDVFRIERWKNKGKFHDLKVYKFDYKKRKITLHYQRWSGGKKVEESKRNLGFFSHDDYFTVIHNALLQNKGGHYRIAGSEETGGKVPVYISHDAGPIKRWGGPPKGGTLLQIGMYKGIFKNKKGTLTILIDKSNHLYKLVLSNLNTIGTMTGVPAK